MRLYVATGTKPSRGSGELIDARDYRWATFYCDDCDDVSVGPLPRMEDELPTCPDCLSQMRLWEILVAYRHAS